MTGYLDSDMVGHSEQPNSPRDDFFASSVTDDVADWLPNKRCIIWESAEEVKDEDLWPDGERCFQKSDFRDPDGNSRDQSLVPHLTLRYKIDYLNRDAFNVMESDSAVEHAANCRKIITTLMTKAHGDSEDVRDLVLAFKLSHGKTTNGPNRKSGGEHNEIDSYDHLDVRLPFWDANLFGVLQKLELRTTSTNCVYAAMGPTMAPNYVLTKVEMPQNPRFVPDPEKLSAGSGELYEEVANQIQESWRRWKQRHGLIGYYLRAIGGEFRPSKEDSRDPDGDAWANVIYLIFDVPKNAQSTFEPIYSNSLPGFFDLTTKEHNALRVEARSQFPYRTACPYCKSRAAHLGNETSCYCTQCVKQGHHKTNCPVQIARITSRKRGSQHFGTLQVEGTDSSVSIREAISKAGPVGEIAASRAFKRFKASNK
jgi:hypothetical protein